VNWLSVSSLDDLSMVRYASGRHLVRLDDGRVATLTAWPNGNHSRSKIGRHGRRARIVDGGGYGHTLPVTRVVDVCGDAP
jgi:hypothetical protein